MVSAEILHGLWIIKALKYLATIHHFKNYKIGGYTKIRLPKICNMGSLNILFCRLTHCQLFAFHGIHCSTKNSLSLLFQYLYFFELNSVDKNVLG